MNPHAVRAPRKARRIEQLFRQRRIVPVLLHVRLVRPVVRRQQARGYQRLPVQQIANQRLAVRGVRQRLPHFAMRQNWIVEIKGDVCELRAGLVFGNNFRLLCERQNHIWRQRIHAAQVRSAFAQFERTNNFLRHHPKAHPFDFGRAGEIVRVPLEDDLLVLRHADETKRPGAYGVLRHIRAGTARHDPDASRVRFQRNDAYGSRKMKNHGRIVGRLHRLNQLKSPAFRRLHRA